MEYPKHLSEKIREEVAVSYLRHELRKIFPSINGDDVENLMKCKELANPRDFWNGVHGVSMGFKLKNIVYLATAQNINWERKKINISELTFGVELQQTKEIRPGKVSAVEFAEFYKNNPDKQKYQLEETVRIRGNDEMRENDPIIALGKMEKDKLVISVHDGNGRLARYLLENKKEIDVFVGIFSGDSLLNYWLPTQVLMDVLFFVYETIKNKDEKMFENYMAVLKDMLKNSESGRYEFRERAVTSKAEVREKIMKGMASLF
ncbi:hypothetical protein KBC75_05450 [Candidatus Shapirobacteria bacterium]|nr:hypothetical protein [Candidatus Shapirobacteria bacterium]